MTRFGRMLRIGLHTTAALPPATFQLPDLDPIVISGRMPRLGLDADDPAPSARMTQGETMNAENTVEFTVTGSDLASLWTSARISANRLLGEAKAGRLALIRVEQGELVEMSSSHSEVIIWEGTFLLTVPGLYEEVSASREG